MDIVCNTFLGNVYDSEKNMDNDLLFLNQLSTEELNVLVQLMTKKFSCALSWEAQTYPVNHVSEIAREFCLFGGNTIANIFRGGEGVSYREILTDVCDTLDVSYNPRHSIEHIEKNMIETVLENAWEEMSPEDKKKLLKDMGYKGDIPLGGIGAVLAQQGARMAGFGLYQGATILANVIAKQVTGQGLSLAANALLTKSLGVFMAWLGPIMWAWMVIDIASASKEVTVPGCIYIASMRQMKRGI